MRLEWKTRRKREPLDPHILYKILKDIFGEEDGNEKFKELTGNDPLTLNEEKEGEN